MLELSCEGAGIWFCMCCCPTSSSCAITRRGPWVPLPLLPLLPFHNATQMVHHSYCWCRTEPFTNIESPILQLSSGFCIVPSFPTAKVFTWMDSLEIQSGCLDSFVFLMLAPWDMVSRPPSQPPWHARALTYMLLLYIKTWWQVPSHFSSCCFFIHAIILHRSDWVLWPTVILALTSEVETLQADSEKRRLL